MNLDGIPTSKILANAEESKQIAVVDKPGSVDPECAICFEEDKRPSVVFTSCGHKAFHAECLMQWMDQQNRTDCPICRQPFTITSLVDTQSLETLDKELKLTYEKFKADNSQLFLQDLNTLLEKAREAKNQEQYLDAFNYYAQAALIAPEAHFKKEDEPLAKAYNTISWIKIYYKDSASLPQILSSIEKMFQIIAGSAHPEGLNYLGYFYE